MSAGADIGRAEIEQALIERHGQDVFYKLQNAKAAIAGLGGLGSNIAMLLVRAGIGKLLLVDFDTVDITNLNRQNYYIRHIGMTKTKATKELLHEINPYVEIETKNILVTEENAAETFKDYNIICEAFDRAENKAMLVNSMLCENKTVVSGSGMAGYLSSNTIKTRKITDAFYICGDGITDSADVNGLMAPRVSICAAHQANMILRIILGETDI